MSEILSTALSGLNDAQLRLSAAASNIANAQTIGKLPTATTAATSYTPQDVVSSSVAAGGQNLGVTSSLKDRAPSYYVAADPSSPDANDQGLVAAPNVDLAQEIVNAKIAQLSYAANAKVIKIALETEQKLLDSVS